MSANGRWTAKLILRTRFIIVSMIVAVVLYVCATAQIGTALNASALARKAATRSHLAPSNVPNGITGGPDNAIWFAEGFESYIRPDRPAAPIGRISREGRLTEYHAGISRGSSLAGIATGPDGNIWFTEQNRPRGAAIGRITPQGTVTEFRTGLPADAQPGYMVRGPNNDLWFTDFFSNRLGRIDMNGKVSEIELPDRSEPAALTVQSGEVYATEYGRSQVARVDQYFKLHEIDLPKGIQAFGIAAGPDGNLWLTLARRRIGKLTPAGALTEFALPPGPGDAFDIVLAPDGNLWFTETVGRIGRITPTGSTMEFMRGLTAHDDPGFIAVGPDGNVWFTEHDAKKIGRITLDGKITTFLMRG